MSEPPRKERHSSPVRAEKLPPLTDQEKAAQEALNTLRQYDRMVELIDEALHSPDPFRLRPHVILDLNRISIQRLESDAGRWRDVPIRIEHSKHEPPSPQDVPRYVDELCDYVNDNWDSRSALHLAAYVMWRLNWIHPFVDGNGRTTRAVSYYVLCAKLAFRIPGVKTIPELVASNKDPYYKMLEAADEACQKSHLDVTGMEQLLKDLLAAQMLEAIEKAESPPKTYPRRSSDPPSARLSPQTPNREGPLATPFSTKVGALFGLLALLFFMTLVMLEVFGSEVPQGAKYLVVIVLALAGALSTAFLGGHASARGTIPLPSAQEHPFRYAVSGGVAVLFLLLILGYWLFLK